MSSKRGRRWEFLLPTEFPVETIPTANALRSEKYVAINPILGQKKIPPPMPVKTPWLSSNCHHLVDRLVMKIPSNCRNPPTKSVGTNKPASSSLPEKAPMKNVRNTCIEPIQLMVLGSSGKISV